MAIVTYAGPDGPRGLTVSAFTSVSLDPPLVLVSIARHTRAHDLLVDQPFTVNILKPEQEDLARRFSGAKDQTFDRPVPWIEGRLGPRLSDSLAYLDCTPWQTYDGGDHTLFVGSVVGLGYDADADALGFFCSRFIPLSRPLPSQPRVPYDPFELHYDAI